MKKVNLICIYKRSTNQIYNITAIDPKGLNLNLLIYRRGTGEPEPYKYNTFGELYTAVLNIAKYNNFTVDYVEEFGRKLYNISFINIENEEVRTDKLYI